MTPGTKAVFEAALESVSETLVKLDAGENRSQ
ncbi:hypothetical protein Pla22_29500 [Rubripirellula amarantea]|uniref:Uncharacterized protein n=1 Tax=Rubripirellula amarantea TaxID=2527999 RepID=A0A5C5WJ87_9BACT|nr:hypothetical protein Pla22_29500 [Rubripirellula amarantea]